MSKESPELMNYFIILSDRCTVHGLGYLEESDILRSDLRDSTAFYINYNVKFVISL